MLVTLRGLKSQVGIFIIVRTDPSGVTKYFVFFPKNCFCLDLQQKLLIHCH